LVQYADRVNCRASGRRGERCRTTEEFETMRIDGGCYCGDITYEAEADPTQTRICHCTDCQQLTGTAFRMVVATPKGSFKLLTGAPTAFLKTAESGSVREHGFCPSCGTPLYSTAPGPGPKAYGVRVGTIRQWDQFVPTLQVWTRSEQPWLKTLDSIRRVATQLASP
jgi:hypothetical protein